MQSGWGGGGVEGQTQTHMGETRLAMVTRTLVPKVSNFGHICKRIIEILPVLPFCKVCGGVGRGGVIVVH